MNMWEGGLQVDSILRDHQIDPERGFLPADDPLLELPDYYSVWDRAGNDLPKLLMSGRVRSWLATMPRLATEPLIDDRALNRAMLLLSYFGAAWVWGEPTVSSRLPESIAIPWCEVAERLGRPPILSYASHALNNWRRLDKSRGIELGNIVRLLNFYGGLDEEWFVLIHIVIEAKAAPAISAAARLRDAITRDDTTTAVERLRQISQTLSEMLQTLRRMPDNCDPYIYYRRVRPFIFGWAGNPALPEGVVYSGSTGFGECGQKFRGETGAQSAIIPAIDAALGVHFNGNEAFAEHLHQLRDYLPPPHKQFIQLLEAQEARQSCREWIVEHRSSLELVAAYNETIEQLHMFRQQHLVFAGDYIARQEPQSASNPTGTGTGGTPFTTYLLDHAKQTIGHKI